jgi:hypothetical protein
MDEKSFNLRRFHLHQQDQVGMLVSYATMLGFNGKDLISIGGKWERLKLKEISDQNLERIKSLECKDIPGYDPEQQFLLHYNGNVYRFVFGNAYSTTWVVYRGSKCTGSPQIFYSSDKWRYKNLLERSYCTFKNMILLKLVNGEIELT